MQNERQMVQKEQLATKKGARVPGMNTKIEKCLMKS